VCFYINKRIAPSTWSVSYTTKDIITLEIANPSQNNRIHIINVYNEVATNTLSNLREAIGKLGPGEELLVLGDFNLHHPLWSTRRNTHRGILTAQPLLTIIEESQLQLITVPGTTTHRWNSGESTIDLTFASAALASRLIYCKVDASLDYDSDHLPIATVIDWSWRPATPSRKRLWTKTDIPLLQQTVKDRLRIVPDTMELKDKESINNYVHSIISALGAGIDVSTPWSNLSSRSILGFNQECKDICTQVQQLRRRWQQTRHEDDYEAYREARNRKGRLIQRTLRNTHRQRVEDVSNSESSLWKLVKWAKNRHIIPSTCTPALMKSLGFTTTSTSEHVV
jgi:hypothetical protein